MRLAVKCTGSDCLDTVLRLNRPDLSGHEFGVKACLPDHLRLLPLPPYSPELKPQEHIWDDLREKYFLNQAFDSMDALEDKLEAALVNYESAPARVHSITAWNWIITALPN